MAWADFGQHVTLTARIREILLNYPEGTSVFKELIQVQAMRCCLHRIHSVSNVPIALPSAAHPAQHGHLPSRPRRKTLPEPRAIIPHPLKR